MKNGTVTQLAFLQQVPADTFALLDVLRRDPERSVPSCPGWNVMRLAGHVGRVHRMAAFVVQNRRDAPPGKEDIEAAPDDAQSTDEYLLRGLARLLETLRATPADSPVWNMTGQQLTAGFWLRRTAHETAVHRADAQIAVGQPLSQIPSDVAIDGVDEFFELMPSRVLNKHPDASLGGSLHLHATDGPGEWMIHLTDGQLRVEHGHGRGDAAIRGTGSDLLLGVWARVPFSGTQFERFGSDEVIANFAALGAF